MKKIGIVTICKCNNYGAELQAYASLKKITQLGAKAEIIDYIYYKSWRFKDEERSKPFIPMSYKKKMAYFIKYRILSFCIEKIMPYFSVNLRRRQKNFKSFHEENSCFSMEYCSMTELYKKPPIYDIYVTGSDQVWNPIASSSIEPYFLTFAPRHARKISYASSFGINEIDNGLKKKYQDFLNQYAFISVREDSGSHIVEELCGKSATVVLDPTFLLDKEEWRKVAKEYSNTPSHYILIYQLSESPAIINLARRISKEKNLPILRITKRGVCVKKDHGINNILDAGPAEFLSLIDHAEYVITNSFHGTAFSVNLNKRFWTVISTQKKNNSRIESLLKHIGLSMRLLTEEQSENFRDIHSPIDYAPVQEKLNSLRIDSESFLIKAIS